MKVSKLPAPDSLLPRTRAWAISVITSTAEPLGKEHVGHERTQASAPAGAKKREKLLCGFLHGCRAGLNDVVA
jgi:hypothetical protein